MLIISIVWFRGIRYGVDSGLPSSHRHKRLEFDESSSLETISMGSRIGDQIKGKTYLSSSIYKRNNAFWNLDVRYARARWAGGKAGLVKK